MLGLGLSIPEIALRMLGRGAAPPPPTGFLLLSNGTNFLLLADGVSKLLL